jgi:LAS superfamily LD-carboxypeptidase LdcB
LNLLAVFKFVFDCSLAVILLGYNFMAQAEDTKPFFNIVQNRLVQVPTQSEPVKYRLLREYGSLWTNNDYSILLPDNVVFASSGETAAYQSKLKLVKVKGTSCTLQASAALKLSKAQAQAAKQGFALTPRGGDACLRSYEKTESLWLSRVLPNLIYYQKAGKLSAAEANLIKGAKALDQVPMILQLEARGLPFDKYRQTSILNSVAAPGSSQHLTGLAFDLAQYADPKARKIMNQFGWYQTVQNDLPHFTYLGNQTEASLLEMGLKKVFKDGFTFWIPDF